MEKNKVEIGEHKREVAELHDEIDRLERLNRGLEKFERLEIELGEIRAEKEALKIESLELEADCEDALASNEALKVKDLKVIEDLRA